MDKFKKCTIWIHFIIGLKKRIKKTKNLANLDNSTIQYPIGLKKRIDRRDQKSANLDTFHYRSEKKDKNKNDTWTAKKIY